MVDAQTGVDCQRCGNGSSTRLTLWVGRREVGIGGTPIHAGESFTAGSNGSIFLYSVALIS